MAKVLLVEDSPTQAIEMRMLLEEGCHEVKHAMNGKLALDVLAEDVPDIVVTDLEMPEVNGLELVEVMRTDYPHIPAILVTARGSEELASQALQKGAAGYVPKSDLQSLLNNTIVDVLGVIRTDASFTKLISTLKKNVFEFEMENDAELISPLVGLLMQVVAGMELISGADMNRLGVAIEHALVNAMFRGNLQLGRSVTPAHHALIYEDASTDLIERRRSEEPYKDRKVYVHASASKDEIRIVIRDEGPGFDTDKVPRTVSADLFTTETGQGLVLMKSFADELSYNESGNEVTMVKRCHSPVLV
ncbi:ATP-binding response regulator [Roseiconus lacunae]|uniref:Response regulator n=1 Tax=Roseiconus lacunae TaxID=2605694 RepID=A0ABT7PGC6_9BACT|nr:response regulator [Roseiconus lacunae]MCD0460423.1 response regulator [Roseiconus lacunae]MDM4015530.1 response regulator [Roseiconus lacunae]WRQ52793.1 response regulator [Stieleria sp. HD01]